MFSEVYPQEPTEPMRPPGVVPTGTSLEPVEAAAQVTTPEAEETGETEDSEPEEVEEEAERGLVSWNAAETVETEAADSSCCTGHEIRTDQQRHRREHHHR